MMMVGMGLGLGLGLGGNTGSPSANPLCDAVARKVCVTAKDGDDVLKLAPHVVYKRTKKDVVTLDAVLLARNTHPVNHESIRTYRVDSLTDIAITDDGFTVLPGFEADDPEYAGRTICVVQVG
jgi:hypothetical protein